MNQTPLRMAGVTDVLTQGCNSWPPPRPGKKPDDDWPPPRSEKGVVVEDGGYHGRGKGSEMVDREKGKRKKRLRETDKDVDVGMGVWPKTHLWCLVQTSYRRF